MLSTKQFGQNRLFKGVAYTIVIGFALLMFLPGSYNLFDILRGGGSQSFITVNGNEVFYIAGKSGNLADIFNTELGRVGKTKGVKAFALKNTLDNWATSSDYLSLSLRNAIIRQMLIELADDLGLDISKEKLGHYISTIYNKEKELHFSDPKRKNTPFTDIDNYIRYYSKNMPEQYKVGILINTLNNGILLSIPKALEDYSTENHKVKVDFAVYTFDNYIKEPNVFSKVNKVKLEKYYHEEIEEMIVLEALFPTKEAATQAKNDKSFFIEKNKEKNKFIEKTIKANDELFKKLKDYKAGDIISKGSKHYIYKIKSIDKTFSELSERGAKYKSVLAKYVDRHYNDFKLDYEKKAKAILKSFLDKANSGANFNSIIPKTRYLKVGRTDYFTLDAGSVSMEKKANAKKALGNINEFIFSKFNDYYSSINNYYNSVKEVNEAFFTTSFQLKKGDISSIKSYTMNNKDVYFVVKKIDERLADIKGLVVDPKKQNVFINNKKIEYNRLIRKFWEDYLISSNKYPVKVYTSNIYKLLDIKEVNLYNSKGIN